MNDALIAADEIYSTALQILNSYRVDAKLVPLVMGTVTQRIETFAIGAMAHELAALESELTELKREPEKGEVDNG